MMDRAIQYLHLAIEIVGAFGVLCALFSKLPLPARWVSALEHAGIMLGKAGATLRSAEDAAKPKPPTVPPLALLALGVALATLAGCGAQLEPVQVAHVGAVSVAEANRLVTLACGEAAVAIGNRSGKVAGAAAVAKCQVMHDRVHDALRVAAASIDAWRSGASGPPACAVLDVQVALLASADMARDMGAKVPAEVDSTVQFVGGFVVGQLGGCKR